MSPRRILIIEDDVDVAHVLTAELESAGFSVECRATAVQGLIAARERAPTAVILDLGLPDFDGHLVLSRLRATTEVPIVVLSARDVLAEKLGLLELGASDYVVKPFEMAELLARLNVQLRHHGVDEVTCGELTLQHQRGVATFRGLDVPLTRTEFKVLLLLARQPGRVYSSEELCAEIWEGDVPLSSNLLRVHISHLRQKLRAAGGENLVQTVWSAGYALSSELRR